MIVSALLLSAAGIAAAPAWSVGDVGGSPGLLKDGRPVSPTLFWQWRLEKTDVRALTGVGVTNFSCFGSTQHYQSPYLKEDGSLTTAYQEAALDDLLNWSSEANFLPRVFVTAPDWWIKAHPEEAVVWSNNCAEEGKWYVSMRESFASQAAREAVSPAFTGVVQRLSARYGDRLMGIHITNGPWGENFSWDALTCLRDAKYSGYGDLSAPMTRAFRRYLRVKYGCVAALRRAWRDETVDFGTARVPDKAAREELNAEGWRDPARGRRVPDYFECQNKVTVDMLEHYAALVKGASRGNLLTLAFYGYTQDEPWPIECDHRAISRALRSKVLDCFSAPHTYHRRKPGEDGAMRCYFSSLALHGKLFFDEGDDMTYLERRKAHPDRRAHSADFEESQAVLYRAFGMALTHGAGIWFMDLTGGNFRDGRLVETIGRCRRWSEESLRLPRAHRAEVAVISQPESEFYMGYRRTPANTVSETLYRDEMAAYYRAGAPFDWYLAEDLEAVRARRYKVVALLDCEYLTDDQYATLLQMKADGVTFVFYHAPGYVSQRDLSWARVRKLTGGDTYRTLARHSAADLRAIFRAAGVHVYTASEDVVFSADASHIMLHARAAGDYAVRLPEPRRVTDLVSGRVTAESAQEFACSLGANRTALFRLEEPADANR